MSLVQEKNRWRLPRPCRRERESDLASPTGWRVHQLLDDVDDFLDGAVVRLQVFFQFFYPVREFSVCGQRLT